MSHSRETEHYQLPLYNGTDIINPLTDFNNANEKIDEVLYDANERSVEAKTEAEAAAQSVGQYDARITAAEEVAANAVDTAEKTQQMVGEEFDPLKDGGYQSGNIVIYQNKLWEFIDNHSGAWDASDVRETTIGKLFDGIVSEVTDVVLANIGSRISEVENNVNDLTNVVNATKVELLAESEV